jgi:hypothetical protein
MSYLACPDRLILRRTREDEFRIGQVGYVSFDCSLSYLYLIIPIFLVVADPFPPSPEATLNLSKIESFALFGPRSP